MMAVEVVWCILLYVPFVFGQTQFIPYITKADCGQVTIGGQVFNQYFDPVKLECVPCKQEESFQIASSEEQDYFCVCQTGYKYVINFGGSNIMCEKCPPQQIRSEDGWNCVSCQTGTSLNGTQTCGSCGEKVPVEREINGALISTAGNYRGRECRTCADNTTLNDRGDRCVRCTEILKINPTLKNCRCPSERLSGGVCFDTAVSSLSINTVPLTNEQVESTYVKAHVQAAYLMCKDFGNRTACQILSNLCVLSWYNFDTGTSPPPSKTCNLQRIIAQGQNEYLPWLFFKIGPNTQVADRVLDDDKLSTEFTFSPASFLEYRVARYLLNGTFLGVSTAKGGHLQLCSDTTSRLDAAYTFGTYYEQTCSIPALELWDTKKYPMEFYDLYIEFTRNGVQQLYAAPVKINNLVHEGDKVNTESSTRNWILTRRFFLVDNVVTTGPETSGATGNSYPQYVRYAKDIEISVTLDSTLGNGRIFPPVMSITYSEVSRANAVAGATINPTFKVKYSMGLDAYRKDFQIAVGTLSTLGVIYAGYKTWVWSKRAGRLAIDFAAIVNFIFFCSGVLSNVFFVITFGIAFYFLIFYKRQNVVYLFLLDGIYYEEWLGLFGSAFALKCLQVAHMVTSQCTVDIFFIDWEKPKGTLGIKSDGSKKENPVSIWRTYFAANEWNEIQTCRKINHIFQIFAVVFFLNYVGFENTATKDPNGQVVKSTSDYQAPYDPMFRYAIGALVYLLVAFVQWLFFTLIYERFFEDKIRDFVDLCSMANISVFIMHHAQYGYYIHGRSVYGKADTNMKEMFEMMKKEEKDLVGQRGLLPNTEQQTFVMTLPRKLRLKYEEVLLTVALEGAGGGPQAGKEKGGISDKQVESYNVINRFLSTFIDHSLKSLDYQVRDKTLLESIMDTEFLDASEKGYFYNDNGHSFDQCLFYGNEITLLLFDTLLFCIIDLIATNFVLSGILTYIIIELVALLRDHGGRKNLAKKTLVDERFLI
uniref:Meckelin-like n=1 Tax=Crassostrea virginica TaxID=6565 RepID=A0A8B8ERS9_CRAVI|nr:meckelin-like [Crassostrea virginica]